MDARSAPLARWVPPLTERALWGMYLWQWLGLLLVLTALPVLTYLIQRLALAIGGRLARLTSTTLDDRLVSTGRGPTRLLAAAALLYGATRPLWLPEPVDTVVEVVARSMVVVSTAWFLLRLLHWGVANVGRRVSKDPAEAARARAVQTQIAVLRAVFEVAIWVVGAALVLVQFDVVRNVGVSLLASAGIAGLAIGLAAQKSLSNILAGIQLSVTQPIRIGDVVIVEGDFGTVQDITLTYVVVRFWDLRHMVVPISYFLEKPFQNWSRGEPRLLGTATLEVDYSTDVEQVRRRLKEVLEAEGAPLWDGAVGQLQVTDVSERTVRLRALVSAQGPGELWDLRCLVRERLLSFVAQHPEWLPRTRASGQPGDTQQAEAAAASAPPPPGR